MSEFQLYDFRTLDRPLTEAEQRELRSYSSRAEVSATRFSVEYSWGDFKGDAAEWMEKYFDAFLYRANWGTRELMLRLPRTALPLASAKPFVAGDSCSIRHVDEHVIVAFRSEPEEDGSVWLDRDDDSLSGLLPLRAELASGDLRPLYIGWLSGAAAGELSDDALEPPCPPGLANLSAAQKSFAWLIRVGAELLEAAAVASPEPILAGGEAFQRWVAELPEAEKVSLLVRAAEGDAHVGSELQRRFREASGGGAGSMTRRTVREILTLAGEIAEKRRREEAELQAQEKARLEREAAEERERRIAHLASSEDENDNWDTVDAFVAAKKPKLYDEAVALLSDLRELYVRQGRVDEFVKRTERLAREHSMKSSFLKRLRDAGLTRSSS